MPKPSFTLLKYAVVIFVAKIKELPHTTTDYHSVVKYIIPLGFKSMDNNLGPKYFLKKLFDICYKKKHAIDEENVYLWYVISSAR